MPGGSRNRTASWWEAGVPPTGPTSTSGTVRGIQFWATVPGRVFGMRVYTNEFAGQCTGLLMGPVVSGLAQRIAQARPFVMIEETETVGWRQCWFHPTVRIEPEDIWRAIVFFPKGRYFRHAGGLDGPLANENNDLHFETGFVHSSFNLFTGTVTNNFDAYGVDVLFKPDVYTPVAYP